MDVIESRLLDCPSGAVERNGPFLSLPTEIRIAILELVFDDNANFQEILPRSSHGAIELNLAYSARTSLRVLLTCRRFYLDGNLIAFQRTHFILSSQAFYDLPHRVSSLLHPKQVSSLRSLTVLADEDHLRHLVTWQHHPFSTPALHLHTLTIAFRSPFLPARIYHPTNSDLVTLLRDLHHVQHLTFLCNGATSRAAFKNWFHRIVGLLMKTDHRARYDRVPPEPERTWWAWTFDDVAVSFTLTARPPRPLLDEHVYMRSMAPLLEDLRRSVEAEP